MLMPVVPERRLNWNQSARTAIEQIKEKNYPESLQKCTGNILACGDQL